MNSNLESVAPATGPRVVEITEMELRERLNSGERDWLLALLSAKPGVRDAFYGGDDSHRLVVAHDVRELSVTALLEFLLRCGFYAQPAALRLVREGRT